MQVPHRMSRMDNTCPHAGIHGMRERAMLIGAQLTIGPADGGGTKVRLVVPPRGTRRPAAPG